MELDEVMRTTSAVRQFTDRPVPDPVVYRILDAARFAPSGGNRQGWRTIVVHDPATRLELRRLYQLGWREYAAHVERGLVPFAPIDRGRWSGPAIDLDAARNTPVDNRFADHLEEVPVLLAVACELAVLAVLDNGLERQSIVGGASVYAFAHNILLAARGEGLGGVMTTTLCRQEGAALALLGVPEGYALAAVIALGQPAHQPRHLRRKAVEDFATVDRFDGPPLGAD